MRKLHIIDRVPVTVEELKEFKAAAENLLKEINAKCDFITKSYNEVVDLDMKLAELEHKIIENKMLISDIMSNQSNSSNNINAALRVADGKINVLEGRLHCVKRDVDNLLQYYNFKSGRDFDDLRTTGNSFYSNNNFDIPPITTLNSTTSKKY